MTTANAATQTEPTPIVEPTISLILMDHIKAQGVEAVKSRMGLSEERFVAMVKGHAFAIFCWQNQEVGQALGYSPKLVGDYGTARWD